MFPDGQLPEQSTIDLWLKIVDEFFAEVADKAGDKQLDSKTPTKVNRRGSKMDNPGGGQPKRIGVHCVAGLGRAPLLVALALVHKGCSRINAIELIRSKRPGSLNMVQANFLAVEYKDKSKKKEGSNRQCAACTIF